jgi:hypothetical protein
MRKLFNEAINSLIVVMSMIPFTVAILQRGLNTIDAVVEVGEANATTFRDVELNRLALESQKAIKPIRPAKT